MHLTPVHRHLSHRLLSTVQRGTAFEYRALELLTKYMSMELKRVGGSYDGGIDLTGWWWVPRAKNPPTTKATISNRRRLRVFAQCKAEKRKMGPAYLRELEGVVYRHAAAGGVGGLAAASGSSLSRRLPQDFGAPGSDALHLNSGSTAASMTPAASTTTTNTATITENPPVVALLVSQSAFTRNCVFAANASPLPFLLVYLPKSSTSTSTSTRSDNEDETEPALGAVFGNPALVSARGVLGGELEIRWERGERGPAAAPPSPSAVLDDSGRPGLWWQGQPLPSWTPESEADGVVLD